MLPATQQRQTDTSILLSKVEGPSMVISRWWSNRLNRLTLLLGSFSVRCNSGATSHSLICAQPSANVLINHGLHRGLAGYPWLDLFIGIVTSIGKRREQIIHFGGLFRDRLKLANDNDS